MCVCVCVCADCALITKEEALLWWLLKGGLNLMQQVQSPQRQGGGWFLELTEYVQGLTKSACIDQVEISETIWNISKKVENYPKIAEELKDLSIYLHHILCWSVPISNLSMEISPLYPDFHLWFYTPPKPSRPLKLMVPELKINEKKKWQQ